MHTCGLSIYKYMIADLILLTIINAIQFFNSHHKQVLPAYIHCKREYIVVIKAFPLKLSTVPVQSEFQNNISFNVFSSNFKCNGLIVPL